MCASIQHTRTRLENALQKTIEIYIGKALSSVRVWWDGQKGRPAAQAVGVWRPYLSEERSVELDDVGTVTAPHHHIQVHQQLLLLLLVHRGPDPLRNQHKRPVRTGSSEEPTQETGEDRGTLRNSEEPTQMIKRAYNQSCRRGWANNKFFFIVIQIYGLGRLLTMKNRL